MSQCKCVVVAVNRPETWDRTVAIEFCPLHAAAPETAAERDHLKVVNAMLLEALENLLDVYQRPTDAATLAAQIAPYMDLARAAIRQARGESNG